MKMINMAIKCVGANVFSKNWGVAGGIVHSAFNFLNF
jgi:hypothetical protein